MSTRDEAADLLESGLLRCLWIVEGEHTKRRVETREQLWHPSNVLYVELNSTLP